MGLSTKFPWALSESSINIHFVKVVFILIYFVMRLLHQKTEKFVAIKDGKIGALEPKGEKTPASFFEETEEGDFYFYKNPQSGHFLILNSDNIADHHHENGSGKFTKIKITPRKYAFKFGDFYLAFDDSGNPIKSREPNDNSLFLVIPV